MGPIGTGKLRVFHRRPKPLHQGQERSKMGKGMEGKWEIVFHDMRDKQSGGVIRLGIFDLERKSFCIFIPRGRWDKRGWVIMAKKLHQLVGVLGRKSNNQEARAVGKFVVESSYAIVVKRPIWGNTNSIAVKVKRKETLGNLQKLEHCVVARWKASTKGEDDLESLGRFWAKSWGIRGNFGLAKLENDRFLLEFEDLEEARRVVPSGNRSMGGLHVGLEHWNPRSVCWVETDVENEVLVRIIGLPISLWSPMILERVREECGGFVAVDDQTKTMGEIQWARILVKSRGDVRPSVLEIEVEEDVYALSLWWECRPVLRKKLSEEARRKNIEVTGDVASRSEQRVD